MVHIPHDAVLVNAKGERKGKIPIPDDIVFAGFERLILDVPIPKDATVGSEVSCLVNLVRLQAFAKKKNDIVLGEMFSHRDEFRSISDGNNDMVQLQSSGFANAKQVAVAAMAGHIPPGILEHPPARNEIDREVLSRSLLVAAESVNEKFKAKLCALFPEAKLLPSPEQLHEFDESDMLISVAPVKKLPRLQVCAPC